MMCSTTYVSVGRLVRSCSSSCGEEQLNFICFLIIPSHGVECGVIGIPQKVSLEDNGRRQKRNFRSSGNIQLTGLRRTLILHRSGSLHRKCPQALYPVLRHRKSPKRLQSPCTSYHDACFKPNVINLLSYYRTGIYAAHDISSYHIGKSQGIKVQSQQTRR